jgi:hypothetical protein
VLLAIVGEAAFADRLERIAFNALPAAFSPDMWAHQYDQQANQVLCTVDRRQWTNNGDASNVFGLEPNFGCCTANMHQGWPKFAAHLWLRTSDDGLVAAAYAPSRASFECRGVPVTVALDTDYPFRETLTIAVRAERPVRFPLLLCVPGWAQGAAVALAGETRPMAAGTLHRVEREWRGETRLELRFPMRPRATVRYDEAVAVERGPLVYSLAIGEQWTRVNADKPHRELPHGDFEVRPTTPWNYALVLDPAAPEAGLRFDEHPVGERPFSPEGAGVSARATGRRLPRWKLVNGWAGEVSLADTAWAHPAAADAGPPEELRLVPYGCTSLRVTEFPRLDE